MQSAGDRRSSPSDTSLVDATGQGAEYTEGMHESSRTHTGAGSSWLFVVVAVVAGTGQLGAGYLYLVSGLVAPGWAVVLFLLWWLALTFIGVRLVLRRSYWLLLIPVVAVATWVGAMWVGGAVLGWTA
jgi:hypothetical protein